MSNKTEAALHGRTLQDELRAAAPHSDDYSLLTRAASALAALQPVVVESEEQLRSLPVGSVILSEAYVVGTPICFQQLVEGSWYRGGRARSTHSSYFLPAVLLHLGAGPTQIPAAKAAREICGHQGSHEGEPYGPTSPCILEKDHYAYHEDTTHMPFGPYRHDTSGKQTS